MQPTQFRVPGMDAAEYGVFRADVWTGTVDPTFKVVEDGKVVQTMPTPRDHSGTTGSVGVAGGLEGRLPGGYVGP